MIGAHDHADGHDHGHAHSIPSRVDPVVAIVATISFIIIIATTPRMAFEAFAAYGVVGVVVVLLSPMPWRMLMRRLLGVSLAALVAAGPLAFFDPPQGQTSATLDVMGLSLSTYGLATLFRVWAVGVLAVSGVTWLGAVTPPHEMLSGLRRLRCPSLVVALVGFVQRFGGLIGEEAARMLRAMRTRGHSVTWAWRAAPLGGVAGTLFLRSLGRAERVHGAMRLRGFDGDTGKITEATYRIDARQASLAVAVIAVILAIRLVAG